MIQRATLIMSQLGPGLIIAGDQTEFRFLVLSVEISNVRIRAKKIIAPSRKDLLWAHHYLLVEFFSSLGRSGGLWILANHDFISSR